MAPIRITLLLFNTKTATFTETTSTPVIVTSSTASERVLTVNGTITVDHDDDTSTDALAITAGGGTYNGTYGTLVVNTDGTYTYTLDTAHASNATRVDDVFTIDVTDSDGTSHQFTVTVPVNHVDDANKESVSITAADSDSAYAGTFTATDVDAGDTSFTFDVDGSVTDTSETGFTHSVASDYGTLYFNSTTGAWKFDVDNDAVNALDAGDNPTLSFDVTATDDGDDGTNDNPLTSTVETLVITITGADDKPVFAATSDTTGSIAENADGSTTPIAIASVSATDAEGDTVTYSLDDAAVRNGFAIDSATGAITYVGYGLDFEEIASNVLTVTASSSGGTATHTVTVAVVDVNEKPVVGSIDSQTLVDTTAVDTFADRTGTFTATDEDTGDTSLTFSVVGGSADSSETGFDQSVSNTYGTLFYNSTSGAWKFVVDAAAVNALSADTSVSFSVTAQDGSSTSSDVETLTINITAVDDAPVFSASSPTTGTIAENTDGSGTAVAIATVTATDAEGDTVTYSLNQAAIDTGFVINASTGAITYTGTGLNHEAAASHVLTVTATSSGGTATHDVTVTVTNVNEAPVLAAPQAQQITDTAADDTFADDTATPMADIDIPTMSEGTILIHGIRFDLTSAADTDLAWRIVFTNTGRDLANLGTNLAAGVHLLSATANRRTIVYNLGASSLAMQTNIVNAINNDNDVKDLVTAEIENVITNAGQQGRIAFADRAEYLISGDFTITTTALDPAIVTSATASDQVLSVTGTITVDHDNDPTTDALAISSGGNAGQQNLNSTDADFLAAHGLDANNDTWWVYTGTYGTLVIKDDGTFSYVLDADNAENDTRADDVFTINVTDAGGTSHQFTLTVPVNHVDDAVKETASISVEGAALSGTFTVTDVDVDDVAFTFDVTGASADASKTGFTHSVASDYGTLFFNNTTGAWQFVVDDAAVNGLSADTSVSFTVSVQDDENLSSGSQTLVINITAANDAPVVNAITPQSITDTADDDSFEGGTVAVPVVTPDSTVDESVIVHGIKFTILQEADKAYQWRISLTNTVMVVSGSDFRGSTGALISVHTRRSQTGGQSLFDNKCNYHQSQYRDFVNDNIGGIG